MSKIFIKIHCEEKFKKKQQCIRKDVFAVEGVDAIAHEICCCIIIK